MNIENPTELLAYLQAKGWSTPGNQPECSILKGGVSNRTVLVRWEDQRAWVLKQALQKLRVREDWFSPRERILHEAQGMQWLNQLCPPASIPKLCFVDKQQYILGMEAVPEPHYCLKELLLSQSSKDDYFRQFAELLAIIHSRGQTQQDELIPIFEDRSFFESLRLEPYYAFTASRIPLASQFLLQLIEDCKKNNYTLVHGDYSPKNILIHQDRLVLLDHEVIHFGDGTFDLGFSLCHLLSKANHLKTYRKFMLKGASLFWETYSKQVIEWDQEKEKRTVDHTIACMLARVHGRSPLEYLSQKEQQRQTEIALALIKKRPTCMPVLFQYISHYFSNIDHA